MRTKLIVFILCIVLVLSLASCKKVGDDADKTPEVTPVVTAEPTATPEPTPSPEPTEKPTPPPTIEPGTGKYAEGIVDEENGIMFYLDKEDPTILSPLRINPGSSASIQFFPTTTFDKIHVRLCTWTQASGHEIEISLYRWMGTYDDTLKEDPVFSNQYADYPDNYWLEVQLGQEFVDGEYLVDIVNISDATHVGIWTSVEENDMQRTYSGGFVYEEGVAQFSIGYTKTPNKKYGPLSDPGI
jgi:hypothetical protein